MVGTWCRVKSIIIIVFVQGHPIIIILALHYVIYHPCTEPVVVEEIEELYFRISPQLTTFVCHKPARERTNPGTRGRTNPQCRIVEL